MGADAVTIAAIVLASAFLSSIGGFAFSALAGAGFAYLAMDPVRSVQTMATCSLAIQLYAVWRLRDAVRWRELRPMIAAGAATVPLGVWLLTHVDARAYAAGMGLFLGGYGLVLMLGLGPRGVRAGAWGDVVAGALGGVTGGLAGFPGASVTIWCSMRGGDKVQQRAVYQPYILAMQLVTLACLRVLQPEGSREGQALAMVPVALLGAIAGLALFGRMTNAQFRVALSALLMVSGAALFARAL
jgi:uncharacterized membrane protein YfcA